MRKNFVDLTGKNFERWTVIQRAENNKHGSSRWLCRCICGTERILPLRNLTTGHSKSCGCLNQEVIKQDRVDWAQRIGETKLMNSGLKATCTKYIGRINRYNVVEITFENGLTTQVRYHDFEQGKVKCPMEIVIVGDYAVCKNPNNSQNTFLVDIGDIPIIQSTWWSVNEKLGYVCSGVKTLHRVLLGVSDKSTEVDHINRNKLDNRRKNLRVCSRSQNACNIPKKQYKKATSKYKGVKFVGGQRKKHWCASIYVNGKNIGLGYFINEEDAAQAYNKAAISYHGEFACLNNVIGDLS